MQRHKDISGQRFGKLTVVSFAKTKLYGGSLMSFWLCRCDCGAELTLPLERLKKGRLPACTQCATGMIGTRVGQLEMLKKIGSRRYAGQHSSFWLCICHGCGRLGEYPQVLLTHPEKKVTCCTVCRKGPCRYCKGEILKPGRSTTDYCSSFCKAQDKSWKQAQRVSAAVLENPLHWKELYAQELARRHADPELDEIYRQLSNENAKKYYQRNREKRLMYWRERQAQKALADLLGIGQSLMELKDGTQ